MSGAQAQGSARIAAPGGFEPAATASVVAQVRERALRKQRLRRLGLLGAAGLLLIMLGVYFATPDQHAAENWIEAQNGTLPVFLQEIGSVVAYQETHIFSKFTGEVVWKIEEGAFVQPGTTIIRLDGTRTAEELEQMQQDLFDKEEAVHTAEEELATVERRYALEISRLKTELDLAKLEYDLVFGRPTEDERKASEWDLKSAELRLAQAQKTYEAHQELLKLGFVTEAVLKQKQLALAREKAEYAKAKILHSLTLRGSTTDSKRQAELKVAAAKQNLETAEFNREADITISKADLELRQIQLDDFKLSLKQKKNYLENANVKSPVRGRVAFVDVWKGSGERMTPIQIGETRNHGADLCKVVDTSRLRVKVRVNESDVPKLKIGQMAEVLLPAFPDRTFKARVAEIGLMATDKNVALSRLALHKAGEAFVNIIEVNLDFVDLSEKDRKAMRLGFTAHVRIACSTATRELMLPWTAVHYDAKGQAFVYVRGSLGGRERRDVALGKATDAKVVVREGLQAGEQVLDEAAARNANQVSESTGGEAPPAVPAQGVVPR